MFRQLLISKASAPDNDVAIWAFTAYGDYVVFPFVSGNYAGMPTSWIDWGDGSISEMSTLLVPSSIGHTYDDGVLEHTIKFCQEPSSQPMMPWIGNREKNSMMIVKVLKPFPLLVTPGLVPVTNCTRLFARSTRLTKLPGRLLAKNPSVTSLMEAFDACSALTSVPANLLAGLPNLETVDYLFRNAPVGVIPERLFANNPLISSCAGIFNGSMIDLIPPDLFAYTPKITSLYACFLEAESNESTLTIPDGFLNNLVDLENAEYLFASIYGAKIAISGTLFPATMTKLSNIARCFSATDISGSEFNIFAPNIVDVTNLILQGTATGTVISCNYDGGSSTWSSLVGLGDTDLSGATINVIGSPSI